MRVTVFALALVAGLVCHVAAHAVLIHPPPRLDSDLSLKEYPCGQNGQYNNPGTGAPTVLAPGTNYFTFRETVNHNGAPYRIAISFNDDDGYDQYVLLDHIGHNDDGATNEQTNPRGKYHIVAVDVPDVACGGTGQPTCTVQLVQVMTDKFQSGTTCAPNELENSCGNSAWVYFSCSSPIQITGAADPAGLGDLYTDYLQPANNSPRDWEEDETSTWVRDCGPYWRLDTQTIPDSECPTIVPTTTAEPGDGGDDPTIAASSTGAVAVVVAALAATAIVFM